MRNKRSIFSGIPRMSGSLLVGLTACMAARAGEPCHYTWVELQRPPGYLGHSTVAMNNLGHVTGTLQTGGDSRRSFVWTPETGMQVLPQPAGISDVRASDINDHGHICGRLSLNGNGYRPFVWDGQNYTVIAIPDWANLAEANGINNRGQVVGMVQNNLTEPTHAFVWEAGQFTDLGEFAGDYAYFAKSVSEAGRIVGWMGRSGPEYRAFNVVNGVGSSLPTPDTHEGAEAESQNNTSYIVGRGITSTDPFVRDLRPLLWQDGVPHFIEYSAGMIGFVLARPNDQERFVGSVRRAGTPLLPLAWQAGIATDLRPLMIPPPGPTQIEDQGRDINASGQVLTSRYILTPAWLPGDLTGDCRVTLEDLSILLMDFGLPLGSYPRGDVDADGDVDLADLAVLLTHWGQ